MSGKARQDFGATSVVQSEDPSIASETMNIVANNFEQIWQPMLQEVWDEGIVSDMVLEVDGEEFKVHRLVMLIYSSKLRQKIKQSDQQRIPLKVRLKGLDVTMMKKALDFMYEGRVDVAKAQLQSLTQLADTLGITALSKLLVLEQLKGIEVTTQNCLTVWESASNVGHDELSQQAKIIALEEFPSLQHSSAFKALSAELVLDYLCSDYLVTKRPEERLLSALLWVQQNPSSRSVHLCNMLDCLPLVDMGWFLDHALNHPLIQVSHEARQRIEQAKESLWSEQEENEPQQNPRPPSWPEPEAPTSPGPLNHHYLVLTGHAWGMRCSNEVVAVDLSQNYQCVSLGHINAQFAAWTNCCIHGEDLFVSGLGSERTEMWRFQLQDGSASLFRKLRTQRWKHAMSSHHTGHLYIAGGYDSSADTSTACVEAIDPDTSTSQEVGRLSSNGCPHNLRCSEVDGNDLAVVGSVDNQGNSQIELWSPFTASSNASVSLEQNIGNVYGIVQSNGFTIVVGYSGTVVCRMKDILLHGTQSVVDCDKYKAPNIGCAVVLTPQDNILLLGGQTRGKGSTANCLYIASVNDVVLNTGSGWQTLSTDCALGDFYIHGYATTDTPLQL